MNRIDAFDFAWELAQEEDDPAALELLSEWGWSRIEGEDAWFPDWILDGPQDSGLDDYRRPERNASL